MNFYFPYKPIKASAFRLYTGSFKTDTSPTSLPNNTSVTYSSFISKDGDTFVATTNAPVVVEYSDDTKAQLTYIDLTATEMDADTVIVCLSGGGGSATVTSSAQRFILYTVQNDGTNLGLVNYTAAVLSYINTAVAEEYGLIDLSLGQGNYNYYGFKRNSSLWVILREHTTTHALTYASRSNNNRTQNDAWALRVSLTYSSSTPILY